VVQSFAKAAAPELEPNYHGLRHDHSWILAMGGAIHDPALVGWSLGNMGYPSEN